MYSSTPYIETSNTLESIILYFYFYSYVSSFTKCIVGLSFTLKNSPNPVIISPVFYLC